jgi:hypothetical protein
MPGVLFPIIITIISSLALIGITFHDRIVFLKKTESGEAEKSHQKAWSRKLFWVFVSAGALLISGIWQAVERVEDNNKARNLRDSLNTANENIRTYHNISERQHDTIKTSQTVIRRKDDSLLMYSTRIQDSTGKLVVLQNQAITAQDKALSMLDEQQMREVSSKSFPFLTAMITRKSEDMPDQDMPEHYERLVVYLKHIGQFPIYRVDVNLDWGYRYSLYSRFPPQYLAVGDTVNLVSGEFKGIIADPNDIWYRLTVSWGKSYKYSVALYFSSPKVEENEDGSTTEYGSSVTAKYQFNNQSFDNAAEFKKAVLQAIE